MAGRADNLHSRVIAWLKVLLPLAALGIVAALFLTSRTIDPERALTGAGLDVRKIAREVRISNPDFAGMTDDGSALRLSADSARPDPARPGRVTAERPVATLEAADGTVTALRAARGEIERSADRLLLDGGVELATSGGYRLTTEAMTLALSRTELRADTTVEAEAPFGRLTAGGMEIADAAGDGTGHVLVFKGGVRLLYLPAY